MKKKCKIYAKFPITCFTVPIIGHTTLNLTPDEIYKCLCSRAEVIELLPNGKSINLDFSNYDKDNNPKEVVEKVFTFNDKVEVKEEVKIEKVEEHHEEETKEEVVKSDEEKSTPVHEQDPVKTQVASRNNNNYQKYNNKKAKNKR